MSEEARIVLSLYSYSEEEQSTFPYLKEYMDRIRPHLPDIASSSPQLERFMLAGLFLTYRAYNHVGKEMTTHSDTVSDDDVHQQRLLTYKQLTGRDLKSAREYLTHIHFGPLKLLSRNPGKDLYHFVLHGR
jgi:hypothetical protein